MFKAPRGTRDLLPGEVEKWQWVEEAARRLCRLYGYREIRTPIFEHTELFLRGVGESTDIVQKEMYTFTDKGGRSITLRPEGTAPVARAYLEHNLHALPQPVKLYYLGPMFRYDRPQAGRLRQFHQFGVECFGAADPGVDAEVVTLTWEFLSGLGLQDLRLELNSVGCPGCRPGYARALEEFFAPQEKHLCSFCRQRLKRNPLRLLDCKEEGCRAAAAAAPQVTSYLCSECEAHFLKVQEYLEALGVPFTVNPRLVRGLDYYTRTTFEVVSQKLGAQNSLAGGGRYDNLVASYGGPPVPGIGVAVGLERVLIALESEGAAPVPEDERPVFVVAAGDAPALEREALRLLAALRRAGWAAEKDYLGRSLKAQLKHAARLGARFVVIVGEEEFARGTVAVRDMDRGAQVEVARAALLESLEKLKGKEEG